MNNTKEIIKELLSGRQYSNDAANWFTLSKPSENRRIIVIGGVLMHYKSIESYAKRILILIKRGV